MLLFCSITCQVVPENICVFWGSPSYKASDGQNCVSPDSNTRPLTTRLLINEPLFRSLFHYSGFWVRAQLK